MPTATAVAELERELQSHSDPQRAANEKRYLKSDLEHWGVKVPIIESTTKRWWASHEGGRTDLVAIAEEMWDRNIHELRMATVKLLKVNVDMLKASDVDLVERLIRSSRTWAYVDELAVKVASPLLDAAKDGDAIINRWATDDDFWVRRSALLVHLGPLRSGEGDWSRFCRLADPMLEEKEFFIRKAIGWVLRDTARKRPGLVYDWILPRAHRASGVTVREAVKRLSPEQAEAVMTAYRRP